MAPREATDRILENSYEFLLSLTELTPLLVVCYDLEKARITFFNEAAARFMGRPASETATLPPRAWLQRIHADERGRVAKIIARLLDNRTSEVVEEEFRVVHGDGSFRWLHAWAQVLERGGDGYPRTVLASFLDITDRRLMERQIARRDTEARRSIGRDIHDGLLQHLVGLDLTCDGLQRRAESNPDFAADLREIRESARKALERSRAIVNGILPVEVGPEGLVSALQRLVEQTDRGVEPMCRFTARGEISVPSDEHASQLYWICAEAITNAVRHANARRIHVEIQARGEREIRLTVSDDGQGLPPEFEGNGGMGTRILKHRASLIDAELEIRSKPGEGTTLACAIRTETP